ncbi:MAG: 30S ribosomal protein S16 [bacterium]
MAATLRLMRFGKKRRPFYRIIVIDKRKKRDTKYIESIGIYDPMANPLKLELNKERFEYWKKNGAEISDGLIKVLKSGKSKFIKAKKG